MTWYTNGFVVEPSGASVLLTAVTRQGAARTVYTDQAGQSAASLPLTISSRTALYVADEGYYALTFTQPDGTTIAPPGALCSANVIPEVKPSPTREQELADVNAVPGAFASKAMVVSAVDAVSSSASGMLTAGHMQRLDTSGGAATWTLPAAAAAGVGAVVAVKVTAGSNSVTVQRAGSDTVNITGTSRVVTSPEVAVTLVSDGVSNWSVVNTDTPKSGLDATYGRQIAPFNRNLDGLSLIVYGHSWTTANGGASATEAWPARLARRLGMTAVNRGVSGNMAFNTAWNTLGVGATLWDQRYGLAVIQTAINDVRFTGASAGGRLGFKNGLRAAICTLLSDAPKNDRDASITYSVSPAWTSQANGNAFASNFHYASAQNAYADISVTVPASGEVYILAIAIDNAVSGDGGAWQFNLDPAGANGLITPVGIGASNGQFTTSGQYVVDTGSANQKGFGPFMFRFTGLSAGAHVIRCTKTNSAGNIYLNGWMTPSVKPPTILVCKDPLLNDWTASSPYNLGSDAALANINADVDTVVAEFAPTWPVVAVDLSSGGWDKTADLATDKVHPNDLGNDHLCIAIGTAAAALPVRNGLQKLP
jgi:hypothetical protein